MIDLTPLQGLGQHPVLIAGVTFYLSCKGIAEVITAMKSGSEPTLKGKKKRK